MRRLYSQATGARSGRFAARWRPCLALALLGGVALLPGRACAQPGFAQGALAPAATGPQAGPAPGGSGGAGATVTFRVEDRRDAREVAETTVLYVNRERVGGFRLDAGAPEGVLTVTVPAAAHYEYALCGTITVQTEEGQETRRVNSAGRLDAVDGRLFEALGASDFTLFYLVDRSAGAMPSAVRSGDPELCSPATS